jgi:hypothetical protein
MPKRTIDEKKAYHRKYYLDHIDRLQGLARVRYWAMVYRMKAPSNAHLKGRASRKISKVKIIKGTFTLTFD